MKAGKLVRVEDRFLLEQRETPQHAGATTYRVSSLDISKKAIKIHLPFQHLELQTDLRLCLSSSNLDIYITFEHRFHVPARR